MHHHIWNEHRGGYTNYRPSPTDRNIYTSVYELEHPRSGLVVSGFDPVCLDFTIGVQTTANRDADNYLKSYKNK